MLTKPGDAQFGDIKTIQSAYQLNRVFTAVKDLDASKVGSTVWVRARVENNRSKGTDYVR